MAPPTPESAGYSRLTEEGPLAPASTPVGSVAARCVSLAVLGVGPVARALCPEVAHAWTWFVLLVSYGEVPSVPAALNT